jgi:hypothetical protein
MESALGDCTVSLTSATVDALNARAVTSAEPLAGEGEERQAKHSGATNAISSATGAETLWMGSDRTIFY